MSGFELCRRVKQHPATRSTMVLELSAPSGDDRVKGFEVGADCFLSEPLDEEELVATINTLVRIRWTQEQLRQRVDELERFGAGSQKRHPREDSGARLSTELAVPFDCITTWTRILKRGDVEQALLQHGLEAIEHNVSLLENVTCELLALIRKSHTP